MPNKKLKIGTIRPAGLWIKIKTLCFRFRVMDPNRPTFESVVDKLAASSSTKLVGTSAKSFKSIAKSVLRYSPREGGGQTADATRQH